MKAVKVIVSGPQGIGKSIVMRAIKRAIHEGFNRLEAEAPGLNIEFGEEQTVAIKKRNPQDATLRNERARVKEIAELKEKIKKLEQRIDRLEDRES